MDKFLKQRTVVREDGESAGVVAINQVAIVHDDIAVEISDTEDLPKKETHLQRKYGRENAETTMENRIPPKRPPCEWIDSHAKKAKKKKPEYEGETEDDTEEEPSGDDCDDTEDENDDGEEEDDYESDGIITNDNSEIGELQYPHRNP